MSMTDSKVYIQKALPQAKLKQVAIASFFLLIGILAYIIEKQIVPLIMGSILFLAIIITSTTYWHSFKNNKYTLNKEYLTITISTEMSEKGQYVIPLNKITKMSIKNSMGSLFEKIIAIKIDSAFLKSQFPNKFITNSWDFRIFLLTQDEMNEIFSFIKSANPTINTSKAENNTNVKLSDKLYFSMSILCIFLISSLAIFIFDLSKLYYGVFFTLLLGVAFLLKAYLVHKSGSDISISAIAVTDITNERPVLRGNAAMLTKKIYIFAGVFILLLGALFWFLLSSLDFLLN